MLENPDPVESALTGHWASTECKVDRKQRGTLVPPINLSVKRAGIEREMCERLQFVIANCDRWIKRQRLLWLGGNKNPGGYSIGRSQ
jgi:hypothetical protein